MTKIAASATPVHAHDLPVRATDEAGDAEAMRRLEAFLLIARFTHR